MAKTLVILNPISGNGNGEKVGPQIQAALREGRLKFDWARTNAPLHAMTLAEQAKRDGYDNLIAVGGDGIVHEVVNGILRATSGDVNGTLGVVPVGSGNDFAKMVPLQPDWREAVRRILAGNTRWFDVGKITADKPAVGDDSDTRYFANTFDTGFGAQVAMHSHVPVLTGTAMYLVAIFKTLVNYSVPRLQVEFADQTVIEQKSTMTVAAIGRCFGGGFWIAPNAQVDDGLFDVMIADGLGRVGILSLLPKVMKGTHVGDPRVKFFKSPRIVIQSPDPLGVECDGEVPWVDAHRLEIQVLPKRLRVIA